MSSDGTVTSPNGASGSSSERGRTQPDRLGLVRADLPKPAALTETWQRRQLFEALTSAAGVAHQVLVGDGVHLFVDDAARRIPELRARLLASGAPFTDVRQAAPTIEDLFVQAVSGGRNDFSRARPGVSVSGGQITDTAIP